MTSAVLIRERCVWYYDAHSGRFMQEDPHPGLIRKPSTVNNKYIYTINNPARFIDPNGEFIIEAMIIGAIVGGLYAHFSGGNIIEGMLIGAAAGAAGGIVGGAVSAGIAPTIASVSGSAFIGIAAGTLAGVAAGAIAGAFAGALTGGIISVIKGGSFEDGALRGAAIGIVAGGVAGGVGGYTYAHGGPAPGGAFGSFIKQEAFSALVPSTLAPVLVAKIFEELDAREEY